MVNFRGMREIPTEEYSPEKAGVGGSIPSLATTFQSTYAHLSCPVCPITVPMPFSIYQRPQLFYGLKLRLRQVLFVDFGRNRESGMPHERLTIPRVGPHHP
jgi:hypothetical protein